jgi:hypothetical protein
MLSFHFTPYPRVVHDLRPNPSGIFTFEADWTF